MTTDPPTVQLKELLSNVRENFWLEASQNGISEDEIKQRWWAQFGQELTPLLGLPPNSDFITHSPTSISAVDPLALPSYADPELGSVSMQRCRTHQPIMQSARQPINQSPINPRKRANSTTICTTEQPGDMYPPTKLGSNTRPNLESGCRKMARTMSATSRPTVSAANATLYDNPVDFLAKRGSSSANHSRSNSASYQTTPATIPSHLSGSPSLHSPLSSSWTSSVPPLTPDSAGIQANAFFSGTGMSRQASLGGEFRMDFTAMNLHSPSSDDSQHTMTQQTSCGPCDVRHPSIPVQSTRQHFYGEDRTPSVPHIAVSAPEPSRFLPVCHQSRKFDVSKTRHASTACVIPQGVDRRLQAAPMERPLKPKVADGDITGSQLTSHQMTRFKSDTGAPAEKFQIPRASYNRPQKEKLKCPHCDKHPNGFRGDHELRRHAKLHHSSKRTAWICIDASESGDKLSHCKHCRDGKQYGAYYNAAAHLRRVHFNPKQGSRKARGEHSDRAGKGGGYWPPMEDLKSKWIREVEVETDRNSSASDGDDDEEEKEIAESIADDEVLAEEANAMPFTNAYGSLLPLPFTVADAGVFGYGTDSDFMHHEPSFDGFDMMQNIEEDVFPFEAPSNIDCA